MHVIFILDKCNVLITYPQLIYAEFQILTSNVANNFQEANSSKITKGPRFRLNMSSTGNYS